MGSSLLYAQHKVSLDYLEYFSFQCRKDKPYYELQTCWSWFNRSTGKQTALKLVLFSSSFSLETRSKQVPGHFAGQATYKAFAARLLQLQQQLQWKKKKNQNNDNNDCCYYSP